MPLPKARPASISTSDESAPDLGHVADSALSAAAALSSASESQSGSAPAAVDKEGSPDARPNSSLIRTDEDFSPFDSDGSASATRGEAADATVHQSEANAQSDQEGHEDDARMEDGEEAAPTPEEQEHADVDAPAPVLRAAAEAVLAMRCEEIEDEEHDKDLDKNPKTPSFAADAHMDDVEMTAPEMEATAGGETAVDTDASFVPSQSQSRELSEEYDDEDSADSSWASQPPPIAKEPSAPKPPEPAGRRGRFMAPRAASTRPAAAPASVPAAKPSAKPPAKSTAKPTKPTKPAKSTVMPAAALVPPDQDESGSAPADDDDDDEQQVSQEAAAMATTPAAKAPAGKSTASKQGGEGAAGKKAKAPKDPHAPKKPMSAYLLWCSSARAGEPFASLAFADQSKALGAAWQTMDAAEKAPWNAAAANDKERYQREMQSYVPPELPAAPPATSKKGTASKGKASSSSGKGTKRRRAATPATPKPRTASKTTAKAKRARTATRLRTLDDDKSEEEEDEAEDEEEDEEEQSEADVEAGACDSEVELRGKGTPSFRRPLIDGSGVPEPASLPLLTSVPCEPREVHAPLSPPRAAPATLLAPAYRPLLPARLPRPLMLNAES
jgi:hypothetical protein